MGTQQVDPRALQLINRRGRRRGHQRESRVERTGLEARLCGGQCAIRAPRGVLCETDGALQECRRGGDPAARLRPTRGTLQLEGDGLIGTRRRCGEMPRTAIRIDLSISRLCQRRVDRAAILLRRRPIHRRAHQRMSKHHPLTDP